MKIADAEGIRQVDRGTRQKSDRRRRQCRDRRAAAPPIICTTDADAFHVFIYAPFEEKVRRLQSEGKSQADAMDWSRPWTATGPHLSSSTSGSIGRRGIFHLMMNSTMGEDAVVETIASSLDGFAKGTPFVPNCFARER